MPLSSLVPRGEREKISGGCVKRPWGGRCRLFVSTLLLIALTVQPTMQHPPNMIPPGVSRRAFLKTSSALAAGAPLLAGLLKAQSREARAPLIAYVGTFSSPPRDVLPTQVDLPPGN